jgi:hypothetical protein
MPDGLKQFKRKLCSFLAEKRLKQAVAYKNSEIDL